MATIIDFTAKLNERRSTAEINQREEGKQDAINNHIIAGREAAAVGDFKTMLQHAEEIADLQATPAYIPAYCDPSNEYQGSKYAATKGLSVGEIPALMRQDIKDAIKRGQLPKGIKVSVRKRSYTYSWAIDMEITALPEGQRVYNREYLHFTGNLNHPPQYPENWDCAGEQAPLFHIEGGMYSKEVQSYLDILESIYNAYQRDNSDSMSDYSSVRYYGSVHIDYTLGEGEKWQD